MISPASRLHDTGLGVLSRNQSTNRVLVALLILKLSCGNEIMTDRRTQINYSPFFAKRGLFVWVLRSINTSRLFNDTSYLESGTLWYFTLTTDTPDIVLTRCREQPVPKLWFSHPGNRIHWPYIMKINHRANTLERRQRRHRIERRYKS